MCYVKGVARQRHKWSCHCTRDDWECAPTHYLSPEGTCEPLSGVPRPQTTNTPPVPCLNFYTSEAAYIKARDTVCQGGLDLSPVTRLCPRKDGLYWLCLLTGLGIVFVVGVKVWVDREGYRGGNSGGGRGFGGGIGGSGGEMVGVLQDSRVYVPRKKRGWDSGFGR